jgi:hypothetical protein
MSSVLELEEQGGFAGFPNISPALDTLASVVISKVEHGHGDQHRQYRKLYQLHPSFSKA